MLRLNTPTIINGIAQVDATKQHSQPDAGKSHDGCGTAVGFIPNALQNNLSSMQLKLHTRMCECTCNCMRSEHGNPTYLVCHR